MGIGTDWIAFQFAQQLARGGVEEQDRVAHVKCQLLVIRGKNWLTRRVLVFLAQNEACLAVHNIPQVKAIVTEASQELAIMREHNRTDGIFAVVRKCKQTFASNGIPETEQAIPSGRSDQFSIRRHGGRIYSSFVSQ